MRPAPAGRRPATHREHVLPTGGMHLVFRLTEAPLRLFQGEEDRHGRLVGPTVVGGARARYYVRELPQPDGSVGAMLRPGAARWLLAATAAELSGRHTDLEDLWGLAARSAHERLLEAGDPGDALRLLEELLVQRLPVVRGLHPVVARALFEFTATDQVAAVVARSGCSHRHFVALFRDAVGLSPKRYCRVLRFRRALQLVAGNRISLAQIALESGYSDQAHFQREFRELAGMAPDAYRKISPALPSHVPAPAAAAC
jgi:AraC-like DNA-binding protein